MPEFESIRVIFPPHKKEHMQDWWEWECEECRIPTTRRRRKRIAPNWEIEASNLMKEVAEVLTPIWQESARIEILQKEVVLLKARVEILERLSPILVPIQSLSSESYELIKPFNAVVRFQSNQYIASFYDANLSASGDTQAEAVFNLKDTITSTFEILTMMDENELGPGPLQQRQVLEEFICRKG